jgi:uroporphyrinogen-III synthase
MRVLVTRPEPGASRTAEMLEARGHTAILAPLMRIAPSAAPPPEGAFDAVVITSANALAAMSSLARALPVLAVGERTAAAARTAGFADVRAAGGDRNALARLARAEIPARQRLLLAVGRDRKADTADLLSAAGHEVTTWIAYAAEAVDALPAAMRTGLVDNSFDAVMHFSRRSAGLAVSLSRRSDVAAALLSRLNVCLSADVAVPLREAGATRIVCAKSPDEAALIAALEHS